MEEFKEEVENLAKEKLNPPPAHAYVFYGSSSFRLWETLSKDIPEHQCLNIGFGGSQIADCSFYFDKLLGKTNPDRILFYAGDNDVAAEVSAAEILERFKVLLSKVDQYFPTTPFTFLSIKPSPIRREKLRIIQETNRLIKAFLEGKEQRYYLDIHSPMLKNGEVRPGLFTEDELHMNADGYALWTRLVREHLGLSHTD